MVLRVFLILTILAGAGVIAVSHFQLRPHIQRIIDEREAQRARANKLDSDLKATRRTLAETETKLKDTQTKLSETETQLAATRTQLESTQKAANTLKSQLDEMTAKFNETSQKLSQWTLLGYEPAQVKQMIDNYKKVEADRDVLMAETRILVAENNKLQGRIKVLTGSPEDPPMPAGLRGKVLVVDPKWDFVVLDIGEKNGAVQNGVLMVSRDSKLVGKVRITNVLPDRSIANIMPGWKLGDVMEGDHVIY